MRAVLRAAAPWSLAGFVLAIALTELYSVHHSDHDHNIAPALSFAHTPNQFPDRGTDITVQLEPVLQSSVAQQSQPTVPDPLLVQPPQTQPHQAPAPPAPPAPLPPVAKPPPPPATAVVKPPPPTPPPPSVAQPPPTPPSPHSTGLVCNSLSINDVAFGVIAGREVYVQEVQRTWMTLTPSAAVFMTTKLRPGKRTNKPHDFTQALSRLKAKFPHAKWYVLSDDDVFFSVRNLLCLLGSKDSTAPHFIGTHHCQGEGFRCQRGKPIMSTLKGWLNGGAGIVLSGALVQKMDARQCTSWYAAHWKYGQVAADVVLSCCVADFWGGGHITHHPGFFRNPPNRQYECECRGRCTMTNQQVRQQPDNVISYHHVSSVQIRNLYKTDLARYSSLYNTAQAVGGNRVSELF